LVGTHELAEDDLQFVGYRRCNGKEQTQVKDIVPFFLGKYGNSISPAEHIGCEVESEHESAGFFSSWRNVGVMLVLSQWPVHDN